MAQASKPNPQILKDDILDYLRREGFAVFHVESGGWPSEQAVWWDTVKAPDYKDFITAARATGAKMILFFDEEMDEAEIADAEDALETAELEPEQYREYARRIGELRSYIGFTSRLGIGFSSEGSFYWYDLEAAWYEDLVEVLDDLHLAGIGMGDDLDDDEDEEDGKPPLGNFYSNN